MHPTDKTTSKNFCWPSICHQESASNKILQASLLIIAASGLVVLALSQFAYLPPIVGYVGVGVSLVSFIALGVIRFNTSTHLDRQINDSQTFSQIDRILNASCMEVSMFGIRYLMVSSDDSKSYSTVDHLARRVEQIIQQHLKDDPSSPSGSETKKTFVYENDEERKIGNKIVSRLYELFDEYENMISHSNIIVKINYWTPRFFKSLASYNDIRGRYSGYEGMSKTIWATDSRSEYAFPGNDAMPSSWLNLYENLFGT